MTTAGEIMAEALRKADSRTRIRAQDEDASIPSSTQAAETWGPAGIKLTEQQLRARRARSIAIALALGAFVLLIFVATMVKLGSGTLSGDDYMRPVQTTK
jgi:hypothetical protein